MAGAITRRAGTVALGIMLVAGSACSSRRVQPAPAPAPDARAPVATPLRFTATAYCTGRITASGAPVSRGVAAADPKVLPLGTVIRVSGAASYDGTYRVLDTGALVRQRHVDLYIPDCAAARQFGRRSVQVTVIRHKS